MYHHNGLPPAPPGTSGAFSSKPTPQPTAFLPDLPPQSWRSWLYALSQQRMLSIPLARWLIGGMLTLGVIWGLGRWPGGWWAALAWLLAALLLFVLRALAGRSHYIHFQPQPLQMLEPAGIPPSAKVPLYVTGSLGVEGRERAFTNLPGFYRTFATREHALICQLRPRRFLGVGALPDDEPGLWYAFFLPEQITRISSGVVAEGRQQMSALAVTYLAKDKQQRRRSMTLHLTFPNAADRLTVLADLIADQEVHKIVATS